MIKYFSRVVPRDFRTVALQINLLFQLLLLIMPLTSLPAVLYFVVFRPDVLGIIAVYAVASCCLWATVPALIYAEKESPLKAMLAFVIALFNLAALSWICIYSWITMRNSKWMTREVQTAKKQKITASSPRIS